MKRLSKFTFFKLIALVSLLPIACISTRHSAGYTKVEKTVSPDTANACKKAILGISNDVFEASSYTSAGSTIRYRLLSPQNVQPGKSYPLVLILHSSGTPIGTDNVKQLGLMAKLWAQPGMRQKYPAYVLVPQFPVRSSNYVPTFNPNILTSAPDACLETAMQLIDSLKQVLPVNRRKIYVMGFSMGASSAINSLGLRPNQFAAAVSISGIPEFKQINTIAHTPVWFIHGNKDTENPIASDSVMYKQLQALRAKSIRYWEVENLEHDVYPALYMGNDIPQWLFKHTRKKD